MPRDSTVTELDQLYTTARTMRRPFEGQAFVNIAYFLGRQWVAFDGRTLYEPQLEPWRAKVVDNRIKPIVRKEIAKMTKTRPTWVVTPRTQSESDVMAARYAEQALDWQWAQKRLRKLHRQALLWSRLTPAGFWKVWWDPGLGDPMDILIYGEGHQQAGETVLDRSGAPLAPGDMGMLPEDVPVTPKRIATGDVCVELRSFFEIVADPLADETGLGSAAFVIEEAIHSLDYVRERFPEGERVTANARPPTGAVEMRLPGMSAPSAAYDAVKLREYWHLPGSTHPQGKHTVWCENTVLLEEDNPFPWVPYVMFGGIPAPGRFWPDGVVNDLISPQTELNKTESQLIENAERIGNPKLRAPDHLREEIETWTGKPGGVAYYQSTGAPDAMPSYLDIPELPVWVRENVERMQQSLQEISSQHEVSAAQVPAGVTAAAAIQMLQEADDTTLGPDISEIDDSLSEAGRRMLWLMHRYFDNERHMRIAGDDGQWDILAFNGSMLDGAEDVTAQTGSGLPDSKAGRQALLFQLLQLWAQNGVPTSERNLRRVLNEFQVGGIEQFFASQARDERQINDENRRMTSGEGLVRDSDPTRGGMLAGAAAMMLMINSYDNDPLHIDGHQDFMKTAAYWRLPPDVKSVHEKHLFDHKMRLANQQLGQMAPAPGEPGPQAAPGQPAPQAPPNGASPAGALPFAQNQT